MLSNICGKAKAIKLVGNGYINKYYEFQNVNGLYVFYYYIHIAYYVSLFHNFWFINGVCIYQIK